MGLGLCAIPGFKVQVCARSVISIPCNRMNLFSKELLETSHLRKGSSGADVLEQNWRPQGLATLHATWLLPTLAFGVSHCFVTLPRRRNVDHLPGCQPANKQTTGHEGMLETPKHCIPSCREPGREAFLDAEGQTARQRPRFLCLRRNITLKLVPNPPSAYLPFAPLGFTESIQGDVCP